MFENKNEVRPEMDDLMLVQTHASQFVPNQYPTTINRQQVSTHKYKKKIMVFFLSFEIQNELNCVGISLSQCCSLHFTDSDPK